MPLTIINIFAVMEIIGFFRHYEDEVRDKVGQRQVISLVDCFVSLAMTGTIYFLAMIMAESLFLVFGIILISAFYLYRKIQQKKLFSRRKKDEKDFSNSNRFAHSSKRKRIRFVWS